MQRTTHSFKKNIKEHKERRILFIKNVKERKECSVLSIKNAKERENVAFFWKERKRMQECCVLLKRTQTTQEHQ